jgi:NADPH:quinone reductase-like Zn-dependent oxidoreductase
MNMKAAVISSFEKPPHFADFAQPIPEHAEVIIKVTAAALHPVVKSIASGVHYTAGDTLPFIPGVDGVGKLADGTRVYFGMARSPYGTMAQKTVAYEQMCMPLPDNLDDIRASALYNPGLSSWLALTWRAQLIPGQTVLINGATGVAGRLAIQIAKHLGAGKIIVTGKNKQALIGLNIIIDYLWGKPAETIIAALMQPKIIKTSDKIRFIQLGDSAGSTLSLPAFALRSSGLELYGCGIGSAPLEQIIEAVPAFTEYIAQENVKVNTIAVPLYNIESVWQQTPPDGTRFVVVP